MFICQGVTCLLVLKKLLLEVRQAVFWAHGPTSQQFGIALLVALVFGFAPSTANAVGLPAKVHKHS